MTMRLTLLDTALRVFRSFSFSLRPAGGQESQLKRPCTRLLACGIIAFAGAARGETKLVFAHQMTVLPVAGKEAPASAYREEIKQWKDLGLDATLLFDTGGPDPAGVQLKDVVRRYYEAGVAEKYHFAVSTSYFPEHEVQHYGDFIASLAEGKSAEAQLRIDGRVLISAFHASAAYPQMIEYLRTRRKLAVFSEPFVYCRVFLETSKREIWETGTISDAIPDRYAGLMDHPTWRGMDGFAAFEIAPSIAGQAEKIRWIWSAAKARNKSARGSIVAYYKGLSHKGNPMVFEGWGYTRLRESWRTAIESDIPHVELITLNDLSESTYLNSWGRDDPLVVTDHWTNGDNPALIDHSGFRYFSKRYVQWFKTGKEPAITRDELYYAYRLHPRNATDYAKLSAAEKNSLKKWIAPGQPANWIYRKGGIDEGPNANSGIEWTRFSDAVHVAVRLIAPADVFVNGVKIASLPAGEHLVEKRGAISEGDSGLGYPLFTFGASDFGFPRFEVRRHGRVVFSHDGELEITPFPVPGCWNIFARRAPDNAWTKEVQAQ